MMPGKVVTYWDLQWDVPSEWMNNYFATLNEEELFNLHWDPVVLLQAGPLKCTIPGMKHASF